MADDERADVGVGKRAQRSQEPARGRLVELRLFDERNAFRQFAGDDLRGLLGAARPGMDDRVDRPLLRGDETAKPRRVGLSAVDQRALVVAGGVLRRSFSVPQEKEAKHGRECAILSASTPRAICIAPAGQLSGSNSAARHCASSSGDAERPPPSQPLGRRLRLRRRRRRRRPARRSRHPRPRLSRRR